MEKQLTFILTIVLFCLLYTTAIAAQTKSRVETSLSDTPKAQVQKLGFGKRVKVKLRNGTKVRGRITGLTDNHFIVTESNTGATMKVAYSDVDKISKQRTMPRFVRSALMGAVITGAVLGL